MRPQGVLGLLGLVFIVACTLFIEATPYRQAGILLLQRNPETGQPATAPDIGAPDERQHANYVARLMRGDGFGVLDPDDPELYENYQNHQPPAYYILAAGFARLVGADPQDPETGSRIRYLNVFIGLGTMVGIYMAAVWGLRREDVGLAAAAVFVTLPMNVALHSAVTNDPLLFAVCTWGLALCIRFAAQGWTLRAALGTGLLIGAGMLIKSSGIALFPVFLLAMIWPGFVARDRKRPPAKVIAAGFLALVAAAAPWLIRNVMVYGDPLALSVFEASFGGTAQASMFIEAFGAYTYWTQWVGWWALRSFIGTFGYMDIFLSDTFYGITLGVFFILGLGAVRSYRQNWVAAAGDRGLPDPRPFYALSIVLSVMILLSFIQFNRTYFQGQGRYLLPAIAPFAFKMALGATAFLGERRAFAWVLTLAIGLVLLFFSYQHMVAEFPRRIL